MKYERFSTEITEVYFSSIHQEIPTSTERNPYGRMRIGDMDILPWRDVQYRNNEAPETQP